MTCTLHTAKKPVFSALLFPHSREDKTEPKWENIANITTVEQTPGQLCDLVADGTANIICYLDRPWDEFVYNWAKTEVDEHGDTVHSSNSYKTTELAGEIECSYSSYEDENGVERENASCTYWDFEKDFQADIWKWEPREYPKYTEVGMSFTTPGHEGVIISAFYIDQEPTPEDGYKADTPYVWIDGVEEPDNLQDAECGPNHKNTIQRYSSKISEMAKRVVFKE